MNSVWDYATNLNENGMVWHITNLFGEKDCWAEKLVCIYTTALSFIHWVVEFPLYKFKKYVGH